MSDAQQQTDALVEALDAIWLAYCHVAQHGVSDMPYPSPEGGGPQVVPCSKAEFVAAFKYMGAKAKAALDQVPATELIEAVRRDRAAKKARAPLMEAEDGKSAIPTKKAILDDTGEQWGYGNTVEEARKDAVDHIAHLPKDELREFIVVLVEDMTVIDVAAEDEQ